MEDKLRKLYTDPSSPACYSGVDQLLKEAKSIDPSIKRKDVVHFLEGEKTYTLHKPRRLKFKRAKTFASGYMTHLQADLGDFQLLSRYNKGYKYLLVAIDVLSRRLFVAPVKTKTPKDMIIAFDHIFKQMPILPYNLFTDRGGEFEAKTMKDFYKEKGIQKHSAQSSAIKAALAERMIRTLKTRLYRYFSEKQTLNWIDVIDKIADAINHSSCRTIGMKPIDVSFDNAQSIWEKVYGRQKMAPLPRYKLDDAVRIAREKTIFRKGYLPTFSDKIYDVEKIKKSDPNEYVLHDDEGEKIKGRFYEPELARTRKDTTYRIEKIIKKTTLSDGSRMFYVKFIGYFRPEWIKESDLV